MANAAEKTAEIFQTIMSGGEYDGWTLESIFESCMERDSGSGYEIGFLSDCAFMSCSNSEIADAAARRFKGAMRDMVTAFAKVRASD